jgi:GTP cyclohydrolase-4
LKEVGVVGVKMPVGFAYYNKKPVVVVPSFDVFVDLPAHQKGIHASRHYEIISEVLEKFSGRTYKLENICGNIALELFRRHKSISRARVKARGEAVIGKTTPKTGKLSYEPCTLTASATAFKAPDGSVTLERRVGVGVKGVTACPCAQEILAENVRRKMVRNRFSPKGFRWILKDIPLPTHMQRSLGIVNTEVPSGYEMDALSLVDVVEKSMSASSYGLLKRKDEAELVMKAIGNPLFAEDSIRLMMKHFAETFRELPDSVMVVFKLRSEESIHKHDFVAHRAITLGDIRKELGLKGKTSKASSKG